MTVRSGASALSWAKLIVLVVPAALLAGAYGSEIWGGLAPCEMCWWQRYAHFAALAFAVGALLFAGLPDRGRSLVWLAVLAILASGAIAVYHAGVEAKIFAGLTQCTATGGSLEDIMSRPMVRCDDVQFRFLGISMAGWNAIISLISALVAGWLSLKRPRDPALA
jgi:disulfide bond formation protein DsbB